MVSHVFMADVVVVVVVFTLTDRASTIPSNIRGCQSGTWSQRGTKVNGSHHGDVGHSGQILCYADSAWSCVGNAMPCLLCC